MPEKGPESNRFDMAPITMGAAEYFAGSPSPPSIPPLREVRGWRLDAWWRAFLKTND